MGAAVVAGRTRPGRPAVPDETERDIEFPLDQYLPLVYAGTADDQLHAADLTRRGFQPIQLILELYGRDRTRGN
jgi:hypothetical protein